MKGQAKVLIPVLCGITPLLLAGITGNLNGSGRQQTTRIAEICAAPVGLHQRKELTDAFRADANTAARELSENVTADLAIELTHMPSVLMAASEAQTDDRS